MPRARLRQLLCWENAEGEAGVDQTVGQLISGADATIDDGRKADLLRVAHGLFGSLSDERITSAFDDQPVFAPDLIGYGQHRHRLTDGLTLHYQARHLLDQCAHAGYERLHLVGHSVGGVVAFLATAAEPDRIASITSVEGNFTLDDAFWSAQIAGAPPEEVERVVDEYRADPEAWIAASGVPITPWTSSTARNWLDHQPATTIQAQARAVVEATGNTDYLDMIRRLVERGLCSNLVAGQRSVGNWSIPDWVRIRAATNTVLPGVGHLMLESPDAFAAAVAPR